MFWRLHWVIRCVPQDFKSRTTKASPTQCVDAADATRLDASHFKHVSVPYVFFFFRIFPRCRPTEEEILVSTKVDDQRLSRQQALNF